MMLGPVQLGWPRLKLWENLRAIAVLMACLNCKWFPDPDVTSLSYYFEFE